MNTPCLATVLEAERFDTYCALEMGHDGEHDDTARITSCHYREVIAEHEGSGEEAWCPTCKQHWPCAVLAADHPVSLERNQ